MSEMNVPFFEEIIAKELDGKYKVTEIVEDGIFTFAFFLPEKYINSNYDDRYKPIGMGPVLYNKETKVHKILGSLEFVQEYYDPTKFKVEKDVSFHELMKAVKARKHVNGDDFYLFMNYANIDMGNVLMSTDDDRYLDIMTDNKDDIRKFIEFFEETNLPYKMKSETIIILDNGELL